MVMALSWCTLMEFQVTEVPTKIIFSVETDSLTLNAKVVKAKPRESIHTLEASEMASLRVMAYLNTV